MNKPLPARRAGSPGALLQANSARGVLQFPGHAQDALEQAAPHLDGHAQLNLTFDDEAPGAAALHDALTGLPNRVLFDDRLAHGLAQAARHGRNLAVMFLDLDDFKQINQRLGHAVGDAVLTSVADRLKEKTRQEDTLGRADGDGFLYLLAEFGDLEDVRAVAEKITQALRTPCMLTAGPVPIRASVGIALFPDHGKSARELIERADQAMYLAKGSPTGYAFAS